MKGVRNDDKNKKRSVGEIQKIEEPATTDFPVS